MASARKDWKKVVREAERQGWRVIQLKSGHWRLYAPDGEHIVHKSGTPSDRRDLANTIARMRNYEFKWRGR